MSHSIDNKLNIVVGGLHVFTIDITKTNELHVELDKLKAKAVFFREAGSSSTS